MSVLKETYESLADFVRDVMETKNLTTRDVERQSGNLITHSYVNKIKNGDAKNPSPQVLQYLAKGLDEPEELLFAIVRGKKPDSIKISNERFAQIAEGYAVLSEQERKSLEPLVTAIELTIRQTTPTLKKVSSEKVAKVENKNSVINKGRKSA